MKCFVDDNPGAIFFAVYSDLSGANLYFKNDQGEFIEAMEGDSMGKYKEWFLDAGYLWFFDIDISFLNHLKDMKNAT